MPYIEDTISIVLGEDHSYECPADIIGRAGEGGVTQMIVQIPTNLKDCSVYLDFEKPNKEKYRTSKLTVGSMGVTVEEVFVAVYDVELFLLAEDGELKVQAVIIAENGMVWKSFIKKYRIEHSINADNYVPEEIKSSILRIDEVKTTTSEKSLLIGQKGSGLVEVITLGEGLKINGNKLELDFPVYNGEMGDIELIKFTIDTGDVNEYTAIDGMTWGEWVNSKYNTDGYSTVLVEEYDGIQDANGAIIMLAGSIVRTIDAIKANTRYDYFGG